ncbi:hypothetical protein X975_00262, partial [Stegodyphus mimosarum]
MHCLKDLYSTVVQLFPVTQNIWSLYLFTFFDRILLHGIWP